MDGKWPFWKWRRWKSISYCLWPPTTFIWNLKLKFQSKLNLCSGNHAVYRQTDGRTRWIHYLGQTNGSAESALLVPILWYPFAYTPLIGSALNLADEFVMSLHKSDWLFATIFNPLTRIIWLDPGGRLSSCLLLPGSPSSDFSQCQIYTSALGALVITMCTNVAKEPIFIYRWNIYFCYIFAHIFLDHVYHMTQDNC